MIHYDYNQLETLVAVAKAGTLDAASKALSLTPSAVSQRLRLLEERVGETLVRRDCRPVTLTETGARLCRHAQELRMLHHDLEQELRHGAGKPVDDLFSVRVAVNADSLATWFPEVIRRAEEELHLSFDILPNDQDFTAQTVKSGDAIAAVTSEGKPWPGFRRIVLGSMSYLPVANPSFMERYFSEGVTLETLSRAPVIFYDRKDGIQYAWLDQYFGESPHLITHWVPSVQGYASCCLQGVGWGLVPAESAKRHIASGELVELLPAAPVHTHLYWQSSKKAGDSMKALSKIVGEVAQGRLMQRAELRVVA